ncbi:MAG: amino acid adenylation domain-containing protein [Candidatus Sulfotelmatobacter sp.]
MSEVLTNAERNQLLESYFRTRPKAVSDPVKKTGQRASGSTIPLTFAQQQLWLHAQLAPDTPLYNEPLTVRHHGQFNVSALNRAFNEIIRRHEAWRTTFPLIDGEPVQSIHPPAEIDLPEIDLRSLLPAARETEAVRIATADARLPFDLTHGPLFRAKLVRLEDEEYRLYVTLHHLIFDGFGGYRVFLPELVALYDAFSHGQPSPLRELPFQFGDYALQQAERMQGAALEPHVEHWRRELAGLLPTLDLPFSRPLPAAQTFRGAMHSFSLPLDLSVRLREFSQRENVTLFMTLLAAFNVLLHRYGGQEDILIGSNTAGRNHPGTEKLLGYFLNTVILRTDLSGEPTFRQLLDRVRTTTLDALSHDEVPLDRLVAELPSGRDSKRNPLFQVLFSLEPPLAAVGPDWDLTCIEVETGATKFELCMVLDDRADGLLCRLIYNTALFDPEVIARMGGHWRTLLEAIVADPARPIGQLPLLTPAERQQILVEWNDTAQPFTPVAIHELIAQQVQKTPHATAVRCGKNETNYSQLDRQAAKLAQFLQARGVGPNVPVALCLDRSLEMIVAILGVLKAGGAYVPLDPANPIDRLELILADCHAEIVLVQEDSRVPALFPDVQMVAIETVLRESAGNQKPAQVQLENLAYILYTSGSTGVPKGVQITHRNLAYSNHARLSYYKEPPKKFLLLSSYAFDSSVAGIFYTLSTGGTLVLPPPEFRWEMDQLSGLIAENKITHTLTFPSLYGELLDSAQAARLASLHNVIVAGESCPRQLVNRHYEILPQVSLFNEYGPTEATVWSSVFECEPGGEDSSVPIGRPIANARLYVLDRHLQLVPAGVPGELYIGGEGVSRGYMNQSSLTHRSFVPDPFSSKPESKLYRTGDLARHLPDGNLEFLGRLDQQVKIRGLRVELEEVEAVLGQHPGVREAAVIVKQEESGDSSLIAFTTGHPGTSVPAADLRAFLRTRLPAYMVPSSFQFLEAMPRIANGKVDRQKLATTEIPDADLSAEVTLPRDDAERRLLAIWKSVLKLPSDDVRQDFFELGGHSLLAAKLLARIEKEFGKSLSLAFVFQSPTIAQMAASLYTSGQSRRDRAVVPIQPKGSLPPLFWVRGGPRFRLLAQKLGLKRPFLGVDLPYADGIQLAVPYRLEDIATYLIEAMREVQPQGPYYLSGLCVNAVIAYEMAQQLVRQGETVALVAMIDAHNHAYYRNPFKDGRYTARIKYHLSNLLRMDAGETSAYLVDRLDEARRKIERITWRLTTDRGGHSDDRFRNSDSIVHPAFSRYEPQPYPGKITLLQSSEWPKSPYFDFKVGWDGLAGSIDFHRVPGDHAYMFDDPNVNAVAALLQSHLDPDAEK